MRDVIFGEDQSRIRSGSLPNIWAIARNLAINLYRDAGFTNIAQAQRMCTFGLKQILTLFRMIIALEALLVENQQVIK